MRVNGVHDAVKVLFVFFVNVLCYPQKKKVTQAVLSVRMPEILNLTSEPWAVIYFECNFLVPFFCWFVETLIGEMRIDLNPLLNQLAPRELRLDWVLPFNCKWNCMFTSTSVLVALFFFFFFFHDFYTNKFGFLPFYLVFQY